MLLRNNQTETLIPENPSGIKCGCIFNNRPIKMRLSDGSVKELTEDEIIEVKVAYYLAKYPNGA